MIWISGARMSIECGIPKLIPSLGEEHVPDTVEEPTEGGP